MHISASSIDEVHGVQLSIPSLCGWGCHRAVTAKMIFLHVQHSVLYMCFLYILPNLPSFLSDAAFTTGNDAEIAARVFLRPLFSVPFLLVNQLISSYF